MSSGSSSSASSRPEAGRDRRGDRGLGRACRRWRGCGGRAGAACGGSALFCLLGGDDLGAQSRVRLEAAGVRVHSPAVEEAQRRGFCYVDEIGRAHDHGDRRQAASARERRRAAVGGARRASTASTSPPATPRRSARRGGRACSSRPPASCRRCTRRESSSTRSSRAARTTPSATRPATSIHRRASSSRPRARSAAGRSRAGRTSRPWRRVRFEDAYGAGDCFAAGLTFALAKGMEIPDALAFASERGALALTRRGAGLTG